MSLLKLCNHIAQVEECLSVLQTWLMKFLSQRLLLRCATLDHQRGNVVEFVLVCRAFTLIY